MRSDVYFLNSISVHDTAISDHFFIHCALNLKKSSPSNPTTVFRRWKLFDIDSFRSDVENSVLCSGTFHCDVSTPTFLFDMYNSTFQALVDNHAPCTQRSAHQRGSPPWFTSSLMSAIRKRRRLERKWRKTRSLSDREDFINQRNIVVRMVSDAKNSYYETRINASQHSSRLLWHVLNELIGNQNNAATPSFDTPSLCADKFRNYFSAKIDNVRLTLPPLCIRDEFPVHVDARLSSFAPVNIVEVFDLLRSIIPKTTSSDPLPTWLVKALCDCMAPILCRLVNVSLSTGVLPRSEKIAVITPILKKTGLDKEVLSNYRPISGLTFLSKFIERVVCNRIYEYVSFFSLLRPFQSAYRKHFSTETALTRFLSDLLVAFDSKKLSFVVLLDLSSAFDTVDHSILCDRLYKRFGFRDVALSWIQSFLNDRTCRISVKSSLSQIFNLSCGVPQGSVLEPQLFSMYVSPISDIVSSYKLEHLFYADDLGLC